MDTATTRLEAAQAAEWAAWRANAGRLAGSAADDRTWAAAMAAHRRVLEEEEALRWDEDEAASAWRAEAR